MSAKISKLKLMLRQGLCKHSDFRPAMNSKGECFKLCGDCDKLIAMTDAEFYAEFGTTLNHALAARQETRCPR